MVGVHPRSEFKNDNKTTQDSIDKVNQSRMSYEENQRQSISIQQRLVSIFK